MGYAKSHPNYFSAQRNGGRAGVSDFCPAALANRTMPARLYLEQSFDLPARKKDHLTANVDTCELHAGGPRAASWNSLSLPKKVVNKAWRTPDAGGVFTKAIRRRRRACQNGSTGSTTVNGLPMVHIPAQLRILRIPTIRNPAQQHAEQRHICTSYVNMARHGHGKRHLST
jgi:hypothetical protein